MTDRIRDLDTGGRLGLSAMFVGGTWGLVGLLIAAELIVRHLISIADLLWSGVSLMLALVR